MDTSETQKNKNVGIPKKGRSALRSWHLFIVAVISYVTGLFVGSDSMTGSGLKLLGTICAIMGIIALIRELRNRKKKDSPLWRKTKKWRVMKVCYWLGMPMLGVILWLIGNATCDLYCFDNWGPIAFAFVIIFMAPLFFLFRWIVGYIIGYEDGSAS